MSIITVIFHRRIDSVSYLLSLYSALILIQAVLILLKDKGGAYRLAHDLIFPLISIAAVFDSLGYIVHNINPIDIDPLLIRLDYRLFNGYPTVMLERFISPLFTDVMQAAYSSYYFLPLALAIALKIRKDDSAAFDYSLFLIMLCFYLSYTGYMLMPALGPRYTMNHLQNMELNGLYITQPLQWLLNQLEGIKRDAFPSGHTGIALTVLYLSYKFEKRLFMIFVPVVTALIFSTVYCRYHYVVDIIGGIILSVITILMGNMYYGYWTKKNNINN